MPDTKRNSRPRSEIFHDIRKFVIFHVSLVFLFFTGFWLFWSMNDGLPDDYFFGFFLLLCVGYIIFFKLSFDTVREGVRLAIFDDGIRLGGIGFWEWSSLGSVKKGDAITIGIYLEDGKKPKIPFQFFRRRIVFHDRERGMLEITCPFSPYYTNMSLSEFHKALLRLVPHDMRAFHTVEKQGVISDIPIRNRKPLRKSIRDFLMILVGVLVFICVPFYEIQNDDFILSLSWSSVVNHVVGWGLVLAAGGCVLLALIRYIKLPVFKRNQAYIDQLPISGFLLYGALALVIFFGGFLKGVGHGYTLLQGDDYAQRVVLRLKLDDEKKEYCWSPDHGGWQTEWCKTYPDYSRTFLYADITGKKSWFGQTIDSYELSDKSEEGIGK